MEISKNILIRDIYGITDDVKNILIAAGYNTIGDLTNHRKEEIKILFNRESSYYFSNLKDLLHKKYKVTFKDEFEMLNLPNDILITPVEDLDLPTRAINALVRNRILILGELLTTKYVEISRFRNVGDDTLIAIKEYVHSLGLKLRDEKSSVEESKKMLRENNAELLEDKIQNISLCNALYKNGIFTLDDLVNCGDNVFKLHRIGPQKREEIMKEMERLNLKFKPSVSKDQTLREKLTVKEPTEKDIESLKLQNEEISKCIDEKEKLIKEYERLIKEQEELMKKERLIDLKLEEIKNEMRKGGLIGRK